MTEETPVSPVPASGSPIPASAASNAAIPSSPERARIEPPPPPNRLDALPVLYLVGFVILAASLIYLWKHPALPPQAALEVARMDTVREQVNSVQARVDQLEKKPAVAVPDLAPLQAQVAALAPLQAQVAALAPLQAQVAALASRPAPAPVDLAPLERRIAALEARPIPPPPARPIDLRPLEARIAALEAKPPVDLGPLQQSVSAVSQKEAADAAAIGKRLDAIEADTKQTSDRVAAVTQKAALGGRLQAAVAALDAGQRLGEIPGAPPALSRFAHDNPPTEAGLRLSFDKAAEEAHRVSQPAITDNQPLIDRMWTRATQAVTVRQGEHVLVGDPISGVIAGARQSLNAGDLAGAVKALDGLAGPAKDAMADWVAQAKALLDARAAIGEMAARG